MDYVTTDVGTLLNLFCETARDRGLSVVELGCVGVDPLLLVKAQQAAEVDPSQPKLLLAAGFHGEEPAGCWGLLDFFRFAPERLFQKASLSFFTSSQPHGLACWEKKK